MEQDYYNTSIKILSLTDWDKIFVQKNRYDITSENLMISKQINNQTVPEINIYHQMELLKSVWTEKGEIIHWNNCFHINEVECGVSIKNWLISQIKGKESENSYQKLKRSL